MASQKPPNSPTIPNTPPSGWVDRSNSYGGWPELYARLDALKRRISRLNLEPQPKPAVSSGNQQVPKWI